MPTITIEIPTNYIVASEVELVDRPKMQVIIPMENIPTEDLAQEFLTRDDCDVHFDPRYLQHFMDNPEKIPDCYLLLKAENLHDQQVLYDLRDTYKMMTV